jgi:hypothetical protein
MEELSSARDSARVNRLPLSLPDADGEREGGGGSGFPSSFPNSLNNLSSPGCICLAIIGKLASSSPKDLISCFGGETVDSPLLPFLSDGVDSIFRGIDPGTTAEMILNGSNVPINGREM